jgi:hypothetical protein
LWSKPARPPRRSRLCQMPAARQMLPKRVRTTAQKRTVFETKWRQIPLHTGELRAPMLLLLSACPTSNPKTQQLLGWYGPSFLIQPQFEAAAIAPVGTANTRREGAAKFSSSDVACHVTPRWGSFMQWRDNTTQIPAGAANAPASIARSVTRADEQVEIGSVRCRRGHLQHTDTSAGIPSRAASGTTPPRHRAACHSITSSARASNVGGTSRPSALAVLRLITSSYLVGACTGRSAGFSPLRMRST